MKLGRVAAVLFAFALVWAGTAFAQTYPPSVSAGQVSRSSVTQCQCTNFSGDGFIPGSSVTVTDNGVVVTTVTANNKGRFKVKVCFDGTAAEGDHQLVAAGSDANGAHEVRAIVTVSGSACNGQGDEIHDVEGGGLSRTGSDLIIPALLTGFGLVVSGAGIVLVTRRRRHRVRPAT